MEKSWNYQTTFKNYFSINKRPPPEGSALGPETPGPLPCYATGPTLGTPTPTERISFILNNIIYRTVSSILVRC